MAKHLTPTTLYRKSKFEKYVNQQIDPLQGQSSLSRHNAMVMVEVEQRNMNREQLRSETPGRITDAAQAGDDVAPPVDGRDD